MRSIKIRVLVTGAAAIAIGICAETTVSVKRIRRKHDPVSIAVEKGMKWLVSVQGKDGGWGQDGGETSYVRQGERLESNGNDVANTAVAAEALLHAGNTPTSGAYHESLQRAVRFILEHVERSPAEGLAVTDLNGTQIQRKLGPYIDTFLTSKLLAELDGNMGNAQDNARVRQNLQKCVAKVEKNQLRTEAGTSPEAGRRFSEPPWRRRACTWRIRRAWRSPQVAMAEVDTYTAKTFAPPAAAGRAQVPVRVVRAPARTRS